MAEVAIGRLVPLTWDPLFFLLGQLASKDDSKAYRKSKKGERFLLRKNASVRGQ